jgi:hypothetical protein
MEAGPTAAVGPAEPSPSRPERPPLRALLSQHAEIVLGVLVEILGFDDVSAPRRVPRQGGVVLIVVAGVADRLASIAGWSDAWWPLMGRAVALRPRAVIAPA